MSFDHDELRRKLDAAHRLREREAIQLGDGIRRGPITPVRRHEGWGPPFESQWTCDVWDDEFNTMIILLEQHPPADLIKRLFRYLKEERQKAE